MRRSMTYGTVPDWLEFEAAFQEECPDGVFRVRSGAIRSTPLEGDWTCQELYDKVKEACTWPDVGDPLLDDVSFALLVLGFEWV